MSRPGSAGKQAPPSVDEHSDELFAAAESLLGGRRAECRFDADRGVRITVIDLDDSDIAALQAKAAELGISEWTRIERADPAALIAWERLRHDLIRLQDQRPSLFQMYPTPQPGYQRPPVGIYFTASSAALAAAGELHDRYGDFVALHVGALPYPPDPAWTPRPRPTGRHRDLVDPAELVVELDGPLSIGSGETVTHAVLVLNTSQHLIRVNTNGNLTAVITDPASGATVGGFTGAQPQPLVIHTVQPGQTVRVPLLVGTASFTPRLGYSIPAGAWQLTAPIDLEDGRYLVTPPMNITVTD